MEWSIKGRLSEQRDSTRVRQLGQCKQYRTSLMPRCRSRTPFFCASSSGGLECRSPKAEVAGSSPAWRASTLPAWRNRETHLV